MPAQLSSTQLDNSAQAVPSPPAAIDSNSEPTPAPAIDSALVLTPTTTALNKAGRPVQKAGLPHRFVDELPSLPVSATDVHAPSIPTIVRRVILHVREYFRTGLNQFRILREYVNW
jgi:hypothetical protein